MYFYTYFLPYLELGQRLETNIRRENSNGNHNSIILRLFLKIFRNISRQNNIETNVDMASHQLIEALTVHYKFI